MGTSADALLRWVLPRSPFGSGRDDQVREHGTTRQGPDAGFPSQDPGHLICCKSNPTGLANLEKSPIRSRGSRSFLCPKVCYGSGCEVRYSTEVGTPPNHKAN